MTSEVGLSSRPSDGPFGTSENLSASNGAVAQAGDQTDHSQNKAVDEVLYSDVNTYVSSHDMFKS